MGLLDKDPTRRLTLPDLLHHPLFAFMGVVTPQPPLATNTTPRPPGMDDDVVRQGSPTRWARHHQHNDVEGDGLRRSGGESGDISESTPSSDELSQAVEGVRTHRRLSLVASSTTQGPPLPQQQLPRGSSIININIAAPMAPVGPNVLSSSPGRTLPKSRGNHHAPS
eukprot:TRINITY_DN14710_c0_g1_i1.p1 TRINITY_DN14710_c0_g1~~TRINITY_DN14710_c0_g1_i1.p1  ORF type:complete len:167 (+),score=17.72 TRINITY_DN14710_c0_g1_i1:131-631(+)